MPMSSPGPQGLAEVVDGFLSAFPDMQIVIDDAIAEPDKVAGRGHFTGTHRAVFMNVPATGKQVTVRRIRRNECRFNGIGVEAGARRCRQEWRYVPNRPMESCARAVASI